MDKNAFDFVLEFLKSEKQHIVKFDDVDMEDVESIEDIEESDNEDQD